jgi:hypothetical protein
MLHSGRLLGFRGSNFVNGGHIGKSCVFSAFLYPTLTSNSKLPVEQDLLIVANQKRFL